MADRKITALTELTAAVADDLLLVVDESVAADADKNKKLKISSLLRNVEAGTAATPSVGFAGSSTTGAYSVDSSTIGLTHSGTQTASLGFTTAGSVVQPRYSIGAVESAMSGTTDAPLHIRQSNTDDAEAALVCESSNTTGTQGPVIELRRKSSSPADNDAIGAIRFTANNDASPSFETIDYASIKSTILDITDNEEDGRLEFLTQDGTAGLQPVMFLQNKKVGIGNVPSGGTLAPDVELHVKSDFAGTALEIECTEVSAASGADLVLYRHRNGANAVANDKLSSIKFVGKQHPNNNTADRDYVELKAEIVNPNIDSDSVGRLDIHVAGPGLDPIVRLESDLVKLNSPAVLSQGNVPSSVTSPGTPGEIAWNDSYLYLHTAGGTWKRIALETNW